MTAISTGALGTKQAGHAPLHIHKLGLHDAQAALRAGFEDWRACRTDGVTLAFVLPLAAMFVGAVVAAPHFVPFLLPICAGFALLGPAATLWFTALSRAHARDADATMEDAAAMFDTPRRLTIQRLGMITVALFVAWIAIAWGIYEGTLASIDSSQPLFVRMFTTSAGWSMIGLGTLAGAVLALLALAMGLFAFPLALDRDVGTFEAMSAALRALGHNLPFALGWGALVTVALGVGVLPALLGLTLVMPVLGHATWHVYRRTFD